MGSIPIRVARANSGNAQRLLVTMGDIGTFAKRLLCSAESEPGARTLKEYWPVAQLVDALGC